MVRASLLFLKEIVPKVIVDAKKRVNVFRNVSRVFIVII